MTFYTCFDPQGQMIARCQTPEDIQVLRRMGRPIADVQPMRSEEAVVCSLTGSPSEYDEEYCLRWCGTPDSRAESGTSSKTGRFQSS